MRKYGTGTSWMNLSRKELRSETFVISFSSELTRTRTDPDWILILELGEDLRREIQV